MNFVNELVRHLSILRGEARSERICFITAPVEDLSDLARTVMKGHGLVGDIQDADRYHITLGVFPDFPESAIIDFLQISLPIKFSVSAARLGTFETAPTNPLVLLVDPDPALVRLQSDIYNLGLKMGLQQSDPDHFKASLWQPHITLALNVEELPDSFNMIKPVTVGVDRFVLQRDGYDEIVEVHLPGSIGDRLLVTVRSVVQKTVQPEIVERITPETGIEVSHEDFMALMRGENVVHGATRRVLKFEDGPFVVVRHGVHIGQEGRPGSRGGSQPGYRHVQGGGDYRKFDVSADQEGWLREAGNRRVTIVGGVEGTEARLLTRDPDGNWRRTEIHDLPTPEEAIALGNKWLVGAEEEITEEQAAEREADDEAAEEFAAREEEYEYGVDEDEFGEVEPIEAEDIYQPSGDETAAEPVDFNEVLESAENWEVIDVVDESGHWSGYTTSGEGENNTELNAILTEDGGIIRVLGERLAEDGEVLDDYSTEFIDFNDAREFAEQFVATGQFGGLSPTIVEPQVSDFASTMSNREGWEASHPDRPNVYRHEDNEAGRMAEVLPTETFTGEERYRVAWNGYGNDLQRRLSADGFRDFDTLDDALTFSEIFVETGSTGQAMERIESLRTGLIEDTGVRIEDAVPEGWTQGRGASFGMTNLIGDDLIEVEVLEKAAFPEDFRDIGLADSGYQVSVLNADADTGDTNESRTRHFLDARQAFIFAENYLESGNNRQADFDTGLGVSTTREFRQDMQFLPEWMDSLTENQMYDGGWAVRTQGVDEFSRTIISQEGVGRFAELQVVRQPEGFAGREEPTYEVYVEYREGGQLKVFSTTPDRMVETLRTMEQYVNGGPPGGQAYEGISWRPAGPNTWIANPSERATNEGEATWDDRSVMDFAQLRTNPDGSVNLQLHRQDFPDPTADRAYAQNATAFDDASRWLAGGQYVYTEDPSHLEPSEPFEGARTFPSIVSPPLEAGLREPASVSTPAPTREPTVDPETGAGKGLDMDRIVNDIRNGRLDVVTNSESVDAWNDFHTSVSGARDWEDDAQGIAESVLSFSKYGGEYDEDFDPYEYLQEGQYLEEYDMEQAQERWDEAFYDEAWPEASINILDDAQNSFNRDVTGLLDERLQGRSMVDLPEILGLSEEEVSALSTDEIERRIYNDAFGEVAQEWELVDDWSDRTWERYGESSQLSLVSEEAFSDERNRLRWNELDEASLDSMIYEMFVDSEEYNERIDEAATAMMDTSRPGESDVVSHEELYEQAFGSSGGDLASTLAKLQGREKRVIFGMDGDEVVTAAAITIRDTDEISIPQYVLDRADIPREDVEGDYLFVEYLASKRKRQGYGTELLLDLMKTASDERMGIAGSSVSDASEFYDHLGAIWVNDTGARTGGLAFVTPTAVQRLYGFMMALAVQAEEAATERAEPNLLKLLIAAEAKGSANMTRYTHAQRIADRNNANREKVNEKMASFTGREIVVERARPSTKKPKAFYAPKKEREYPEYFEGQEQVGHGSYGTQVFTPYLLGHVDTWEGSRQGAALQAYHRVVGAQKAQDKEIHGFALAHGGRFVGVGSLNFSPDEKPDEKDWISVETLAISEDGHSEAAMEKIIGEAAKYNRGVFLYGGDGAEEFLTAIGMRKGENGQYHYTHEDVKQLASELKGPTPDRYIAPTAKPRLRPRFGRLFEESEVKAPINNEAAPQSREQQTWQARDKWERFNWEAWKDPELVWNPENQMAMGMEEQQQELFQEEVDEEREKGKSDLLNKIKESGTNSVSFSHLAKAAAELYGGNARKGHQFLKEAREYEMEYGTEAVWPGGKIKPHDPAHYERLGEFAGEIEGVKGDDSEGSWLDAAEFIYTRTQEAFEISEFEEGDKIRLYRGIPAGHLPEANDGGWVDLDLNALSSWTFNRSTAAHVATQSGEGVLLRTDIPISRVFSMWATGPGSRESMEYLILGQDGTKAWATKINRK